MNYRILLFILLFIPAGFAHSSKVKDIVSIKGIRENQLVGYGLVVGLKGTGDSKVEATSRSLQLLFKQLGLDLENEIDSKNVAAVMLTATLPPFARLGSKIDVSVASIGNAKSLLGGTLLFTPLKGPDQKVYATAQGALTIGGYSVGDETSGQVKNHPTVGKLPQGAIIENEIPTDFFERTAIRMNLNQPDFTTAARLERIINNELGGVYAKAKDSATIDIIVPFSFRGKVVDLLSIIENLEVVVQMKSKIVLNEKTGTVVMGSDVRIRQVAIAHGNLSITVKSEGMVEEIADKSKTADTNNSESAVKESKEKLMIIQGTSIGEVISALNHLGVGPRDLITIIQTIKTAGAIDAEIVIL